MSYIAREPVKKTPALCAAVVAGCLVAAPLTQLSEGKRNVGYLDPAHIATICWGHTGKDVRVGAYYNDGTCHAIFTQDQQREAFAAASCTPIAVVQNKYVFGSIADFSFNAGAKRYCNSSMALNFRSAKLAAGCQAYQRYIYATDRRTGTKIVHRGLKIRRDKETAMCLKGAR